MMKNCNAETNILSSNLRKYHTQAIEPTSISITFNYIFFTFSGSNLTRFFIFKVKVSDLRSTAVDMNVERVSKMQ